MNFFLRKSVAITLSILLVIFSTYFSIKRDLSEMILTSDFCSVSEFCIANKVNTLTPEMVAKITGTSLPIYH